MQRFLRAVIVRWPNGTLARCIFMLVALCTSGGWARELEVEGVHLSESEVVTGTRLLLNGYTVRKRGYLKSNVVALYLPKPMHTTDAVLNLNGPRRLQIRILREMSGSAISRIFISDMERTATTAEFKQLIDVVAATGAMYADIKRILPGDVTNVDWIPGKGIVATLNGKPLGDGPINNELAYQIYLRMFMGANVSDTARDALLGNLN